MKKVLQLVALSLFVASLGLTMHKCAGVAQAFEGSAPVAVSNGDVSLTCADDNRILGKTNGSVTCLDDIPDDVTQNVLLFGPYTGFPANDNYLATYAEIAGGAYLSIAKDDPDAVVGVMQYTGTGLIYDLSTQGNATVVKQNDNSIAAGDRVKLDTRGAAEAAAASGAGTHGSCIAYSFYVMNYYCGKVMTAAANERAIGIARSAAATSDTTVDIILGVALAPTSVSGTGDISVSSSNVISFTGSAGLAQNAIRHVAFMQNLTSVSSNADEYFPAIGVGKTLHVASVQAQTPTVFPSGAIVDGIVCNCDAAPASGKTVKFRLCKKSASNNCDDTSPDGSDMISQCTITDSTTTCTDTDFSGTSSLSTNDKLYYYIERDGGGDCNFYSCRFPYTQSEY